MELPIYEGIHVLSEFHVEFEDEVSEPQWFLALEEALKATPARWWENHKNSITGWSQCQRLMIIQFGDAELYHAGKYDGQSSPKDHLTEC